MAFLLILMIHSIFRRKHDEHSNSQNPDFPKGAVLLFDNFEWSKLQEVCRVDMEPINGSVESSPSRKRSPIEEALELLELCWFFENLLNRRKPRMPSSNSDPCLSKIAHQVFVESPAENVCLSTLNVSSENGVCKRRSLLRTPSLPTRMDRQEGIQEKENSSRLLSERGLLQKPAKPPYVERKEQGSQGKESSGIRRSKQTRKPPHGNLLRTPSLPPCIGREKDYGEKETAARIRNSTQPNLSEFFPSRREILEKNFSTSRCRIPISDDKMWHQLLIQMRRRRSLSELESEEVQGFKDLGFTFDRKDINPTVVEIIPGLREEKEEELDIEGVRRPYLSEAWLLHGHLPPIPKWDSRKSAEDMKQQIKFWARAVAFNVH